MEKIFDIAKDSEKSWGVIAQGIDGNFEEVEGKIEKLGSIILGESKETTEENITTDSASYKDYKFSKAIPKGAKIITLIAPSKAGYFLRVNGELGEKISNIVLPYITTEEYIGISSNVVGDYKVVYETGENLEGLETTVGNMKGITETNKTNINIINNLIKGHTPVVKTETINSTGGSYKDYLFEEIIPAGCVLVKKNADGYLLRTDGELGPRISAITTPYTTTEDYKGVSTNYTGEISITYNDGTREEFGLFLEGKNIVCFGDSLTELFGNYGFRWTDYFETFTKANVINVGVGGARFQQRRTPSLTLVGGSNEVYQTAFSMFDMVNVVRCACDESDESGTPYRTYLQNAVQYLAEFEADGTNEPKDFSQWQERLLSIDWNKVDGTVIFAGTNDWNNASEYLGESGSYNPSRTLGAINEIIRMLTSKYKHLKIYWFTPVVRWLGYNNGMGDDEKWSDIFQREGRTLREYCKIIEEEVRNNHIPVCDLYNTLCWNKYNFSNYFPSNDGTHPLYGFGVIAKRIAAFINANRML